MAFREQKVASRVCDQKWHERTTRLHQQKLLNTKSSIDNKPPPQQPHMYLRLKKAALEEERQSKIERDNRILVKRMTEIMQRSAIETRNTAPMPGGGRVKSLNAERRHRELVKVTAENQALLRRIQQKGPTYNHLQWEQDRSKNEDYIARLARHPKRRDVAGATAYYYDDQNGAQGLGEDAFGGDFGGMNTAPPAAASKSQPSKSAPSQATSASGGSSSGGGSSATASSAPDTSSSGSAASGGSDDTSGESEGES